MKPNYKGKLHIMQNGWNVRRRRFGLAPGPHQIPVAFFGAVARPSLALAARSSTATPARFTDFDP
ncbi:MAG TPA: hypothetical protein VGM09_18705, partial [Bradyrhizobium sp.]